MFGVDVIKTRLKQLPQTLSVYRMLDEKVLFFMWESRNLKNRVVAYTQLDQLNTFVTHGF